MASPRRITTKLTPTPQASHRGRQFLQTHLAGGVDPEILSAALLLASELITNAVRHARTEIALTVSVEPTGICVEVGDGCGKPPVVHHTDSLSGDGGWGMRVVSALSDSWGVRFHPEGKTVWFHLAADLEHR